MHGTRETFRARNVVLCTGYTRVPHVPALEGLQRFAGTAIHSSEYRNAAPFGGQRVLATGYRPEAGPRGAARSG